MEMRAPPPPLVLSLPPGHHAPGHPYHGPPDLTKTASPSPGLRQPPSGNSSSSTKPTFASALRDLAKNAGDNPPDSQRRPGPPTPTPVASTLQDVRKGFDRPTAAPPFSPIPSSYSSSPLPTTSMPQAAATPTGFQPYRPSLSIPPQPIAYHPGLLPPGYASLPPEADPMYQAQMARYMAAMGRGVGVPSLPSYPAAAGFPLHPSLLPPGSPAYYPGGQAEIALLHDQLRAEELRRMGELEAELRQTGSKPGIPSPSSGEPALHRLSRIASQPGEPFKPGKRPLGPGGPIPPGIKLPTKPLDFSELSGTAAQPLTVSTPSPPASPPLPSPPSVSRCLPYVHKPRDRSRAALTATSTPKKLFVRPFEDDYSVSPIAAPSEGEVEVTGEVKVKTESGIVLEELANQKEEQEDSDYESMSSDSSIKKEGDSKGMVCPTSGHLLPEDEECDKKEDLPPVFREPDPELPSQQKDKLKYLRYFRLVTHRKKNDIEIQKLEKRKSRLRERSPSPPPVEDEVLGRCASPSLPLPSVPPHLNKLPESHAKVMYLSAIGLCRNTEEQKVNHEQVWSAVLEDRLTRDRESTVNKFFVRLRSITEQQQDQQGVKRTWNGAVEDVLPPSSLRTPLNIPSCEALCRLQEGNEARVSLPSNVEINLCSLQPIAQPSLLVQEVNQEYSTAAPPAHLQHHGLPRNLSPFARGANDSVVEPEDLSQPAKRRKPSSPLPWQGVDAITEAYRKFRADCETERAALLERSSRAGAEVLARRCQVDNLSTRLSSLARLHKTLVGNQGHTLAILETLRSQLGALSNYTPPIK